MARARGMGNNHKFIAGVVVLWLVGCGNAPQKLSCEPGSETSCSCDDGASGSRKCNEDFFTWSDCVCDNNTDAEQTSDDIEIPGEDTETPEAGSADADTDTDTDTRTNPGQESSDDTEGPVGDLDVDVDSDSDSTANAGSDFDGETVLCDHQCPLESALTCDDNVSYVCEIGDNGCRNWFERKDCSDHDQLCAPDGYCQLGTIDDPCADADRHCATGNFCSDTFVCQPGRFSDPCNSDRNCISGLCVEQLCRSGLPGEPCRWDTDCLGLNHYCGSDNKCEATIVFTDDFESVKGWTVVDEGIIDTPSEWVLEHEEGQQNFSFRQYSNIYDDPTGDEQEIDKLGTLAHIGKNSWKNYLVSVEFASFDDDALGLVARYLDDKNYYRFSVDLQRSYARLVKRTNGEFELLAADEQFFGYDPQTWSTIALEVDGGSIRAWLGGQLVLEAQDSALTKGEVGLYCWGNAGTFFDNLTVSSLEKE